MKYVVTTGWWCKPDFDVDCRKTFGSDEIREKEFFYKWLRAVNTYTAPQKILIIDSNSPVKPRLPEDSRIEFLSLNANAGHSTNHIGDWCGYTRAAILGMSYALCCEVDYWVYIEQDALIYGRDIIERSIENMSEDFMFGSGDGTPQVLQQSFMIMKTSFIPIFIKNYSRINTRDNLISPETKFALAALNYLHLVPEIFFRETNDNLFKRVIRKLITSYAKRKISKSSLPFGYGRSRPIDFGSDFFYFQHGSKEELDAYEKKIAV